jgi:hypothetical protein
LEWLGIAAAVVMISIANGLHFYEIKFGTIFNGGQILAQYEIYEPHEKLCSTPLGTT